MAGGNNNINRMSPRQRMINLMYIVLTAMLALNVSSDVLNGFRLVHEGLIRTNKNISRKAELQYLYLESLYEQNERKVGPWLEKASKVHSEADILYTEIEKCKLEIAKTADGPDGDPTNIESEDNLNAAGEVMLNPVTKRGEKLRIKVAHFRDLVLPLVGDKARQDNAKDLLTLDAENAPGDIGPITWEQKSFENMPAVAAVTLLTKLQNDIRSIESDAYNHILSNVDISNDLRVNELNAYVIPNSNTIMAGGKYSAQIVLAAVDTAARPAIYVGGNRINSNGLYEFNVGALGTHEFSGYIELMGSDGTPIRRDFRSQYTVIEPAVTISPTMMNVLYAGIDNPISISAPGVSMDQINASMTNGTLSRKGNQWIARVSQVGAEAKITVSATLGDGRSVSLGAMVFRIRKLPDPKAYMAIGGNEYKGTPRRIGKGALMGCKGVSAKLDDGVLDIPYTVISFSTVFYDQMGNAIPEVSAGSAFSARQIEQFKRLKPGKSFFITNIKAKGPDGIVRDISPMEVGLN